MKDVTLWISQGNVFSEPAVIVLTALRPQKLCNNDPVQFRDG